MLRSVPSAVRSPIPSTGSIVFGQSVSYSQVTSNITQIVAKLELRNHTSLKNEGFSAFQVRPSLTTRAHFSTCGHCNHDNAPTDMCASSSDTPKCWSCPVRLSGSKSLFCKECGVLQPPVKQDHFALFNMAPTFDIDTNKLELAFHALQNKLHPDRFCSRSQKEQTFSLAHAAHINSSYTTLRDPLARARYLISLHKPELLSEETTVTDTTILMEILELRERVADTDDSEELFQIYQEVAVKKAQTIEKLSAAFKREDYNAANDAVNTLSYYYSLNKELLSRVPGEVFSKHNVCPTL